LRTITFYSFKGGVGRTMALVNVAAGLVKRGRKVLVVDFDLEAPGLETYKQLSPAKAHPGIVEYVSKFINERHIPELCDYIYEPEAMKEYKGKLSVMPAGKRDPTYRHQLIKLDWRRFYLEGDGFRFFEETKAYWQELGFDYVLVDSRMGDTDVLGICTRQLPDSVVILFVPNEQNRAGLEHVCRDIRREFEGLPKKTLHFVAANVPNLDDEDDFLRDQIKTFKKDLAFRRLSAVIRRYESLELLDQSVVVLDRPRSRLAKSYRRLTETLMKENFAADRDGALLFLNDEVQKSLPRIEYDPDAAKALRLNIFDRPSHDSVRNAREIGHTDRKSKKIDPLNLIASADQFLNDPEVLNKVAECWILRRDFRSAINVLDRSLKVNPNQGDALYWRGHCKRCMNLTDGAADDFLRCIGPDIGVTLDAIYALRELVPNRLIEAADRLISQGVHKDDWHWIAYDQTATTSVGIPFAAKLMRALLQSAPDEVRNRPTLSWELRLARCWKEIFELYGNQDLEQLDAVDLHALAFAQWAQANKLSPTICETALHRDETAQEQEEERMWLLWGAGRTEEALNWLHAAEEFVRGSSPKSTWYYRSPWTLDDVESRERYLEDCQKVRRFMQGEPLRPPFLGPSTS
jgi:cellulose biosynthesis protein BcsQ